MADERHIKGRHTTGVLDKGAPEVQLARYRRGSWAQRKGWAGGQGSMGHQRYVCEMQHGLDE